MEREQESDLSFSMNAKEMVRGENRWKDCWRLLWYAKKVKKVQHDNDMTMGSSDS